ncbi:hypothetical protein VB796_08765 [Arcicella sp. LKC2W]|uniref:hypothetical protein n=1 Tax=Arcicella sp. LKC2W TaxID=2984198 RepID=UPI002B1FC3CF|nr:hypothetical protein [Arcicella sp. LKC2W]MEA5459126.1 hypothetical protein [Arcicella sp. LKC2W]
MKLTVAMFPDTYKFLLRKMSDDKYNEKDKEVYRAVCLSYFQNSLRRKTYLPNLLKRKASNRLTNDYLIELSADKIRKFRDEQEVDWEANVKFNCFLRKQLKIEFMAFMKGAVTFGKQTVVQSVENFKGLYDLSDDDIKSENLIRYYHRFKSA